MMSIPTSDPIHAPIMISVQNIDYSRLSIVLYGFMARSGMNGNTVETVFCCTSGEDAGGACRKPCGMLKYQHLEGRYGLLLERNESPRSKLQRIPL